jgi:hypothetical protein
VPEGGRTLIIPVGGQHLIKKRLLEEDVIGVPEGGRTLNDLIHSQDQLEWLRYYKNCEKDRKLMTPNNLPAHVSQSNGDYLELCFIFM